MKPEERALRFMSLLKQRQGEWAGKPLELMDWQVEVVRAVWGNTDEHGNRVVRFVFAFVPRKNGKTLWSAAMGLALLCVDGEEGAEIYCAASDKEQSGIVYEDAAHMVRNHPKLAERCECIDYRKRIIYKPTGGVLRAISSDAAGAYGYRPSGVIYDELHLWRDRRLYDALQTGMASRRQPLGIGITTAGVTGESPVCAEVYDYAKKVDQGIITDPSFHAVLHEADPDSDWTDPEVWKAANPGYGITVKPEYLANECEKAKEVPARQNVFMREHLNMWTAQTTRWLDMAIWDENAGDVPEGELAGVPCYAGLDLSQTEDLTALVLAFPLGEFTVLRSFFFVPEENAAKRERRDRVPYLTWMREGHIEATSGNTVDYSFVRAKVNQLADQYNLQQVAYDPMYAHQLAIQLAEEDGIETIKFRQGFYSMAAPTREFHKRLTDRAVRHGGNPVLRWQASNVTVRVDPAGNWKPDKGKSHERINGIVAAIMAVGLCMDHVHQPLSVYESRGALFMGVR